MLGTLLLSGLAGCTSGSGAGQEGSSSREVEQLFRADQADRTPPADGRQLTEAKSLAVGARDLVRLARAKEMYRLNLLTSPQDFYHAAVILQHSWDSTTAADDHLLAHELAIVAFVGKVPGAGYLVAASEDRFLQDDLHRKQRFGTQYPPDSGLEAGEGVTDSLRARFEVPSLAKLHGRMEGRKDGRMEGRKDGRMEGRKDGRMEGRKAAWRGALGKAQPWDGRASQSRANRRPRRVCFVR